MLPGCPGPLCLPLIRREAIVAKVAPQVVTLAQHKYASNVVEACFKHGLPEQKQALLG